MAYPITKTDSTTIATIADGTVNSSATSLTLIGKNYAGYGNFLNENFVKLLENFAYGSAPSNPQTGQLWYDTANKQLKISTNGSANEWKPIASLTASTTTPTSPSPVIGDQWWDTVNSQLKIYSGTNENPWVVIGPSYSTAGGQTGVVPATISSKNVLELLVSGSVVGIISGETTPFASALTGFATIYPGLNLSTGIANIRLTGDANNATKLSGLTSSQFLRSDINDSTLFQLGVDSLVVQSNLTLSATTTAANVYNSRNNSDLDFYITKSGAPIKVIGVNGTTATTTFANAVTILGNVTANAAVSIVGVATLQQGATVGNVIVPTATGTQSVGSISSRFGNVYANVANTYITNTTTVNVDKLNASGYIQSAVYASTAARDLAITSPAVGMMCFVTADSKFYGYANVSVGWVSLN